MHLPEKVMHQAKTVRLACFFCCLLLVAGAGCAPRPEELVPPFKIMRVYGLQDNQAFFEAYEEDLLAEVHCSQAFYRIYAGNQKEADRVYKGKVVHLVDCTDPHLPYVDASGEKYVTGCNSDAGPAPQNWRKALRCYVYRPGNPVVEGDRWGSGFSVTGVCMGKINGIIVLRNCSFRRYQYWGGNW